MGIAHPAHQTHSLTTSLICNYYLIQISHSLLNFMDILVATSDQSIYYYVTAFWPLLPFHRGIFHLHINNSLPINPKRCGLFGLLDMRGGADSTHFGKTYCYSSKFHFRATNRVSYESWGLYLKFDTLLRLLRLKLRPREVAEVARFQAIKNWSKILKSAIFELHKHYIPQKKAENNCHSDLK